MVFSIAYDHSTNQDAQALETQKRRSFFSFFYIFTQKFAWLLFAPFFLLFFDLNIYGKINFSSAPTPLIIIVNHIGFLDGFLLNVVAGFSSAHRPFRHMAVRQFKWPVLNILTKMGLIDFIYNLFGVFVVTPGLGLEKNLEAPNEILRQNGTVVIYPEGTIMMGDHVMPFRKGAAVLSLDSGVPILPISFRKDRENLYKRKIYVNIGKPIFPNKHSVETLTSELYQSVNTLFIRSPHFWIYENN